MKAIVPNTIGIGERVIMPAIRGITASPIIRGVIVYIFLSLPCAAFNPFTCLEIGICHQCSELCQLDTTWE